MSAGNEVALVLGRQSKLLTRVLAILRESGRFYDAKHSAEAALSVLSGIRFSSVVFVSAGSLPREYEAIIAGLSQSGFTRPIVHITTRPTTPKSSSSSVMEIAAE